MTDRAAAGKGALAVTPHHLATDAAMAIMDAGGSAADAAIAANAVLGVVAPETCGPGGDLFALIYEPGNIAPSALNASGAAGSGVDAAAIRASDAPAIAPDGPNAVTIPGCVDGWEALLEAKGRLSLSQILVPAVDAAGGFAVSPGLAGALARARGHLADSAAAAPFYPQGEPVAEGEMVARPAFAETLEAVAQRGRTAFFNRIGPGLVDASQGAIHAHDLDARQAEWVEPLSAGVFGQIAWTIPPNSQGYLVLASAWIAERLGHGGDFGSAEYHHALIEAYRSVAWERDELVSDPASAPVRADALVDEGYLGERMSEISRTSAGKWGPPRPARGGTAYLCVVDDDGVGVSLIQSNFTGFGGGRSAGDTGVFLHNRGLGFTLEPGHPNELRPGARPLHTLSPTLWTTGSGELRLLLGTRGGHLQPQLLLQVAAHVFLAGRTLEEAQNEPRWSIDHFGPGADSSVRVEQRMATVVVDGLRSLGHSVEVTGRDWEEGWGPVSMISVDGDARRGVSDRRVATTSAAAA